MADCWSLHLHSKLAEVLVVLVNSTVAFWFSSTENTNSVSSRRPEVFTNIWSISGKSELTFMLHHSVMHSQQKRCPQGVDVVCLLSSRHRMQRATRAPLLAVCSGLQTHTRQSWCGQYGSVRISTDHCRSVRCRTWASCRASTPAWLSVSDGSCWSAGWRWWAAGGETQLPAVGSCFWWCRRPLAAPPPAATHKHTHGKAT